MVIDQSRRSYIKTLGAAAVGGILAGCGGDNGGDGSGNGNTVDMTDDLVFAPDSITISVGETVTWDNVGTVGHSVTAYEGQIPGDASYFASGDFDNEQAARDAYVPGDTAAGDIPGGEIWEHTFEVAGSYEYFCIPHEAAGMVGTVDVQEG